MAISQLDSENADRDLTSQVTILTHTPSATDHMICQGYVEFGDGSKNLDGTGGDFELTITIGSQTVEPDPQTITFSTATRTAVWTTPFPVPSNNAVVLKAKSPNAADTDVDVTAYLFDVSAEQALTDYRADTITEPAQGAPPATPTQDEALAYLYFMWRNKTITDATSIELYDNAGSTVLTKATLSDDGTDFTKAEYITGA